MKKNRFTDEQFIGFHKQVEPGMPNKVHACITAFPWSPIIEKPDTCDHALSSMHASGRPRIANMLNVQRDQIQVTK